MEMVLFVGGQGAGKTTFYKQMFFDTHLRVNLDMLRMRHRERLLLQACIAMKQRFVVDNTNPTVQDRERYLVVARDAGFRVLGYHFDVALPDLLQRNAARSGKARVPDLAIKGTVKKLQPPALAEGFDALYRVVPCDGGFDVTEIPYGV